MVKLIWRLSGNLINTVSPMKTQDNLQANFTNFKISIKSISLQIFDLQICKWRCCTFLIQHWIEEASSHC